MPVAFSETQQSDDAETDGPTRCFEIRSTHNITGTDGDPRTPPIEIPSTRYLVKGPINWKGINRLFAISYEYFPGADTDDFQL